ncbi:MAG: PIG-L family deacetylase, partial [Verrucomicrobiota bacterium]|nr:PIG-L family deacetylase [Verrucomicrobiota bacterium]
MLLLSRCTRVVMLTMFLYALSSRAAKPPEPLDAAEIRHALEKLNVLGRVLYVAAHPDDENTGLISFWANGALYETAYLSMTRGDGGQNLIGPELREQLGVIRTQELLAARRLDHGQQFFTRANDFGYSKSVEETLRIWDREKILADTVWVIRRFRPDVIVTRFAPDDNQTHGHHTASAQLAQEAFRAAADPQRFPEQLRFVQPWQATRLLWNTSPFFFRARNIPFDPAGLISIEAGGFQPLLGKSFTEIAAASRTMHKSQGFGVDVERGAQKEFFKLLDGKPVEDASLFSGVDTTWSRVPNAAGVAGNINAILAAYDMTQPSKSVPALLELRKTLLQKPDDAWRATKRKELDTIIAACLGLHLEAVTEKAAAEPGQALNLQVEAINRSDVHVQLKSMRLLAETDPQTLNVALPRDELVVRKATVQLPATLPFSQPYWLREPGTVGTFAVDEQTLIGEPENPPAVPVEVTVSVNDQEIVYSLESRFRRVDRVAGEVTQALVIAPPVFVELPRPVFVFGNDQAKTFDVRVIASAENVKGSVSLEAPPGWKVDPATALVDLHGTDSETSLSFKVTPPDVAGEGT